MTISLLARAEALLAAGPAGALKPPGLAGATLADRLQAIVALIADTILPRNLIFSTADGLSCTLTAASGRLMRVSVSAGDGGHYVVTADPGASRDDQLVVLGEALAGLAAIEEPVRLEQHPLAEDVAADDVGQTAADLARFCEEQDWFRGFAPPAAYSGEGAAFLDAAHPWTLAQTVISAAGEVLEQNGAEELQVPSDLAAALAAEQAGWADEVAGLIGPGMMISTTEAIGGRSLAIGLTASDIVVNVGEAADRAALIAAWVAASGGADKGRGQA